MSMTLGLGTYEDRRSFAPGQIVAGKAMWMVEKAPERVEVRLFWYTSGKGTRDVGLIHTHVVDPAAAHGETTFSFTLPAGPYSFSGRLVSLMWALELVLLPGERTERLELIVSPTGREIVIYTDMEELFDDHGQA